MKINVWSYEDEYKSLGKKILKEVDKVFSSGQLILGKNVKCLESNFSKYLKLKYGIILGPIQKQLRFYHRRKRSRCLLRLP